MASMQDAVKKVQSAGRFGDTQLMHVNPIEAAWMHKNSPTGLTINPDTGQPEAFLPLLGALAGGFLGGSSMMGLGIMGSAAMSGLGSFLGSMAQGDDMQQGLMTGLLSFGTAGILGSMMSGAGAAVPLAEGASGVPLATTGTPGLNPYLGNAGALGSASPVNPYLGNAGALGVPPPAVTAPAQSGLGSFFDSMKMPAGQEMSAANAAANAKEAGGYGSLFMNKAMDNPLMTGALIGGVGGGGLDTMLGPQAKFEVPKKEKKFIPEQFPPEQEVLHPWYDDPEYEAKLAGGKEIRYFNPIFRGRNTAAEGGIVKGYARGGLLTPPEGYIPGLDPEFDYFGGAVEEPSVPGQEVTPGLPPKVPLNEVNTSWGSSDPGGLDNLDLNPRDETVPDASTTTDDNIASPPGDWYSNPFDQPDGRGYFLPEVPPGFVPEVESGPGYVGKTQAPGVRDILGAGPLAGALNPDLPAGARVAGGAAALGSSLVGWPGSVLSLGASALNAAGAFQDLSEKGWEFSNITYDPSAGLLSGDKMKDPDYEETDQSVHPDFPEGGFYQVGDLSNRNSFRSAAPGTTVTMIGEGEKGDRMGAKGVAHALDAGIDLRVGSMAGKIAEEKEAAARENASANIASAIGSAVAGLNPGEMNAAGHARADLAGGMNVNAGDINAMGTAPVDVSHVNAGPYGGNLAPDGYTDWGGNANDDAGDTGAGWGGWGDDGGAYYRGGGLVRRGYANGGQVQPQQDPILLGAVAAIRGEHPEAQKAVQQFIQVYGQERFAQLRQQVIAEATMQQRQGSGLGALVKGPGTDTGDKVPATIEGDEPVMLSNNEVIIPAKVVKKADPSGGGNPDRGAKEFEKLNAGIMAA